MVVMRWCLRRRREARDGDRRRRSRDRGVRRWAVVRRMVLWLAYRWVFGQVMLLRILFGAVGLRWHLRQKLKRATWWMDVYCAVWDGSDA
jgi:hypothetical protein